MLMQKGFNTDISISGVGYHVQTEDWGRANPYLVSQIYRSGAMVRRVKIGYDQVLPQGSAAKDTSVRLAMELQHKKILDLLVSGKLFKINE